MSIQYYEQIIKQKQSDLRVKQAEHSYAVIKAKQTAEHIVFVQVQLQELQAEIETLETELKIFTQRLPKQPYQATMLERTEEVPTVPSVPFVEQPVNDEVVLTKSEPVTEKRKVEPVGFTQLQSETSPVKQVDEPIQPLQYEPGKTEVNVDLTQALDGLNFLGGGNND